MRLFMQQKIWFYLSIFPSFMAVLGLSLAYLSYSQLWGGDAKIATVIAVFFCEIVMVIAVFGALTYMKQEKTSTTIKLLFNNIIIAIMGALTGIYLFLA